MIKTLGNNIVNAFTGGNPVKVIYAYGEKVWPISGPEPTGYYIKWTPSTAEGQFNIAGTTHNLSAFSGIYYWSTGIINSRAFKNNKYIQSIETNATSIGSYAFQSCSSLSQASLSMCKYVANSAFQLTSLLQLSLPVCSYIGNIAFRNCSSLSQVNLPMCSYISSSAFQSCRSLSQLSLPVCSYIGSNAFYDCRLLEQLILPECQIIKDSAFYNCSSLSRITIGYSGVCSLVSSNAFNNTQITSSTGSIYVPSSLVASYKDHSIWSNFKNRIFAI